MRWFFGELSPVWSVSLVSVSEIQLCQTSLCTPGLSSQINCSLSTINTNCSGSPVILMKTYIIILGTDSSRERNASHRTGRVIQQCLPSLISKAKFRSLLISSVHIDIARDGNKNNSASALWKYCHFFLANEHWVRLLLSSCLRFLFNKVENPTISNNMMSQL